MENSKSIIIIGAGPGGYELALKAAKERLKVLLIENNEVGGTCLNVGCIPTKSYYQNAKILHYLKKRDSFGISGDFNFDFSKAYERKNQVVKSLIEGIKFSLNRSNVEVIKGFAKIIDENTVEVNNEKYSADYIVIATGSSAMRLNLEGFDLEEVLTSEELLSLDKVPSRLVIIGGGVIGIEMACIFASFGSTVDVIEMCDNILPQADKEIAKRLENYLKQQGINIHTKSRVTTIQKNDNLEVEFLRNEKCEKVSCEYVLLSIGRIPNIKNIGLDDLKIEYDKSGIKVNENFQTNVKNIYAIGDVTGKKMLAHSATYSGYRVLNHILGRLDEINFDLIPSIVFSFPEVASIGLTTEEAINKNITYESYKSMYRANGKALAMGEADGFVKILVSDGKIIGIHIIGAEASNLVSEALPILNENISVSKIKNYIHAHPTLSEIFASCIQEIK